MGWETGTKREFAFDPNSTEAEGRFRLYDPANIAKDGYFRRKSSTAGVSYVMGKANAGPADGKSVIQAVRFDKETFTEAEASKWWSKNHGGENLVFSDERKKEAMNNAVVAAELVRIAEQLVSALPPNVLDKHQVMSAVTRSLGYQLDARPIVSTGAGTTWAMRSEKDWLEIQVTLEYGNQVSIDILPFDESKQEEIYSEQRIPNITEASKLFSIIMNARRKALANPLLNHLRQEAALEG